MAVTFRYFTANPLVAQCKVRMFKSLQSVDVYSCLYVLYSGGSAATDHYMISHLYLAQPIDPYPGL